MLTLRSQRLWVALETIAWTLVAVGLGVLIVRYVDRAFGLRDANAILESTIGRPPSQDLVRLQALPAEQPDITLWSPHRIAAWKIAASRPQSMPLALLRIPRIHLAVPVLEGTDEAILDTGVGHVEETALPGGDGNSAIAGHCDGFFRGLKDVMPGDAIELETLQGTDLFRVQRTWIVSSDTVSVLAPTRDRSLTLVTCYPFYFADSAPQRYIVRATLVSRRTTPTSGKTEVSGF